jgi:anti-anti-sigma factor
MAAEAVASPLKLDIKRSGEEITVLCHGRLVAEVTQGFSTRIRELIPGSKRIVLDLTDLTHMDSMGIGTVVRLYVSAKSAGSCLELINLGPRIRHLLGITNLLSVLTTMCEQGVSIRF